MTALTQKSVDDTVVPERGKQQVPASIAIASQIARQIKVKLVPFPNRSPLNLTSIEIN